MEIFHKQYDAYFKEQLYQGIIEPLVMKFRNDVSTSYDPAHCYV
jgi:hypothetical protein